MDYKNANDDQNFSTPWLFSGIFTIYIFAPILILSGHFIHIGTFTFILTFFAIIVFWMIILKIRYNKKKMKEIYRKYEDHKWNESIKSWIINWGLLLIGIIGIFMIGIWRYLFMLTGLI